MAKEFGFRTSTLPGGMAAILILATPALALSLAAQQQGPLPAPPVTAAAQPAPSAQPAVAAAAPAPATKPQSETSAITHEPPSIPVEQIVQKFGDRELEFKKERDNYTYTQTFVVQTIDMDGRPDGEYRMTSDILFTPEGKRYEKVISAPPPTLQRISLSQQDMDDLEHVQPFVLTSEELPKYDVKYIGREQVDELSTYVFDVGPKKIEKNQRYFQGRIWVDDKDLNIVKSDGKAVPDIIKKGNENVFPRFETFRENLRFSTGAIHIRMTVRYANYKRFGATIKIGTPVEIKEDKKPAKP